MLNILCIVRFYPPGSLCGSYLYLHTLLKWLQAQGHTVTVMMGENVVPYDYEGIKCVPKPLYGHPYVADADIVFTQLDFTALTCELVKSKPIVWFYHNHSQYGTVKRCSDRVVVVYNSEAAQKENAYPNNRSLVLAPPVDIDFYSNSLDFGVIRNCITLINLNEAKGGALFWKLADELPEYKFLGVKGSYGTQWSNDSRPNVEIIESQTDMREVYKRTEILIMPSDYESWGRTATEAAASGIPVISTDTPGLRENMGEAGIYLDKRRIKEWVMTIKKLKGKKEYAEQSEKVKKRVQELRPDSKLEIFEEEIHKIAKKPFKKREYGNG